jgi:hypothetical protein
VRRSRGLGFERDSRVTARRFTRAELGLPPGELVSATHRASEAKTAKGANPALVCPHCQERGQVSTRAAKIKVGISSGKTVTAVLTGGLSLLVPGVGLSRKQAMTEATCGHCGSVWLF